MRFLLSKLLKSRLFARFTHRDPCRSALFRSHNSYPETKTDLTDRCIRVATEETGSSLACISMCVETGSRYESVCCHGISHFIEHVAYKCVNGCQLEHAMTNCGINLTCETSREIQIFSAICFPEYIVNIIDIFSKIITEFQLSDYEIEQEKHNICMELIEADTEPKTLCFDYLHQTAFQGTPLMRSVIGPTSNIARFDREMINSFLCETYQPHRLVIASSGGLQHETIFNAVNEKFGNLSHNNQSEMDCTPCRFTGSEVRYRDDSMPFCHVAIAVEVPGYKSDEYLSLLVASHMIGSWDRTQGGGVNNSVGLAQAGACANLCVRYESFYIPYGDVGLWGIYFVAEKMQMEDFLYNIHNEWKKMAVMCTSSELERAVNDTKLILARRYDGCIRSCQDIGVQMLYRCRRIPLFEFYEGLNNMQPHHIREIGDKYIYDKCPAVSAIGCCENLPDYNWIRSGMYWLRV